MFVYLNYLDEQMNKRKYPLSNTASIEQIYAYMKVEKLLLKSSMESFKEYKIETLIQNGFTDIKHVNSDSKTDMEDFVSYVNFRLFFSKYFPSTCTDVHSLRNLLADNYNPFSQDESKKEINQEVPFSHDEKAFFDDQLLYKAIIQGVSIHPFFRALQDLMLD